MYKQKKVQTDFAAESKLRSLSNISRLLSSRISKTPPLQRPLSFVDPSLKEPLSKPLVRSYSEKKPTHSYKPKFEGPSLISTEEVKSPEEDLSEEEMSSRFGKNLGSVRSRIQATESKKENNDSTNKEYEKRLEI